jgi:DNA-binding transcriptional ArsR family regulator
MINSLEAISELLQIISAPARLEILLLIGAGEACVCHIETRLGYRQAYISQHLMALRQAGLLEARREGKFVFYHLLKPEIMPLIQRASDIVGVTLPVIEPVSSQEQCAPFSELREAIVPSVETLLTLPQEQHA